MNLHDRLVGAMDAVMMALVAFTTAALLLALIEPASDPHRVAAVHESGQGQYA